MPGFFILVLFFNNKKYISIHPAGWIHHYLYIVFLLYEGIIHIAKAMAR